MIEILKFGQCANCDVKTMDLTQRPQNRKLPNYTENWFLLADGSLMKVGLCSDCNDAIDMEMAQQIMERHFLTWQVQIDENDLSDEEKQAMSDQMRIDKAVQEININEQEFIASKN